MLWKSKCVHQKEYVRLTEAGGSALECLSSRFKNESKGRQEETLASRRVRGGGKLYRNELNH